MKVCMLVWGYWPDPTGGAEAQCRKLAHALTSNDVTCCILTASLMKRSLRLDKDGCIEIHRIALLQRWLDIYLMWRAKRKKSSKEGQVEKTAISANLKKQSGSQVQHLLEAVVRWGNAVTFILGATCWFVRHRRDFDIIHVHTGGWLAGYAGWVGGCLRIPVVCKASNMPALPVIDKAIPFRQVLAKKRMDIDYVAMHAAIRCELLDKGIPTQKVACIPNGVVIPFNKAEPATGSYVLYVGNFSQGTAHKAFDILLKAWALVEVRFPSAQLTMAGHGDAGPWRKMADGMGCAQSVHFTGYVADLDQLYSKAALLVLPSRHEGMSNALLEAQAWGLPAVVSDIPGNRAVVSDGETGIVVPVDDHVRLAEAILHLLENPDIRKEMGKKAEVRMEKNFSVDQIARQYVALYTRMIRS